MRKNILIIISSLAGILLFSALSCNEKNINLEPNFVTEDAYFKTETEFTRGVLGVYAKLSDFYWYRGGQSSTTMPIFLLMGDDITCNDQDEFEQFGSLQPSSGRVTYFYQTCYRLVGRANTMIQKIEQENGIYTTANLKNTHRGEALFLRGFGYYYLANYFGTSPLVVERVTSADKLTPPSTTGTQLLDQAIADFTEAASLLPASWNATNRGRVTANSANGMLGKCLVFRGTIGNSQADYTAALAAFNKISGAALEAKFDDNFAFDTENNGESLFEFQASQAFGFDNVWLDNDFDNAVGALSAFWGFYDNNFALFGKSPFFATNKLLNVFDLNDPRLPLTLDPATREFKKYVARNKLSQSGVASANNPRLLRFAEVLLLKAEATLQSGGSKPEAIGYINEIRTRARNMTGGAEPANYSTAETDANVILGWITKENLLELSGEGGRWLDIRRWHIGGKLTLDDAFFSSNTNTMSFQNPKHLLFPIPTIELDVNPNVTQNSGY